MALLRLPTRHWRLVGALIAFALSFGLLIVTTGGLVQLPHQLDVDNSEPWLAVPISIMLGALFGPRVVRQPSLDVKTVMLFAITAYLVGDLLIAVMYAAAPDVAPGPTLAVLFLLGLLFGLPWFGVALFCALLWGAVMRLVSPAAREPTRRAQISLM